MSTKRQLDEARQRVTNAAIEWAEVRFNHNQVPYSDTYKQRLWNAEQNLREAAAAAYRLAVDLNGDRPANASYTSIAAAKSWPAGGLRRRVLTAIYGATSNGVTPGLTTDSLEVRLNRAHTSVSSAVNYLVNHGLLEKAGARQKTRLGRLAECYRLTPLAQRLIAEDAARIRVGE
jgi:hypothetical protein